MYDKILKKSNLERFEHNSQKCDSLNFKNGRLELNKFQRDILGEYEEELIIRLSFLRK